MNREQMNASAEKLVQKAIAKSDDHAKAVRAYYELGV